MNKRSSLNRSMKQQDNRIMVKNTRITKQLFSFCFISLLLVITLFIMGASPVLAQTGEPYVIFNDVGTEYFANSYGWVEADSTNRYWGSDSYQVTLPDGSGQYQGFYHSWVGSELDFTNYTYCSFWFYGANLGTSWIVKFSTNIGTDVFYQSFDDNYGVGWHELSLELASFSTIGSPDWSSISQIELYIASNGQGETVMFDYIVLNNDSIQSLFSVSVTYDYGSTITPNGTFYVHNSDNITFIIGAQEGYIPYRIYIDGSVHDPLITLTMDNFLSDRTIYVQSKYVGSSVDSPIGLTEIMLFCILIFFMALALFSGEAFLFAVAAFISIIFGLDLAFIYLTTSQEWAFGVAGFSFILFGVWILFYSMSYILKQKGRAK